VLTLVINPGGTARVVTIAEALLHFGVDVHRFDQAPEQTTEERRRRVREQRETEG
jgi:hypothetical protein